MTPFSSSLLRTHNLTAYSLAKKIGCTPATIYAYRDGKMTPTLPRARRIAKALNFTLENLLFLGEKK